MDVITVSLDVLLRLPAPEVGQGAVGRDPAVHHARECPFSQTTVTPRTTAQFRNQDGDSDYTVGYKVGGGIAFQVAPSLMVFAEYRYMRSEVSVDLHDSATVKSTPVHFNLDTHFAVLGLSARW